MTIIFYPNEEQFNEAIEAMAHLPITYNRNDLTVTLPEEN